MDGEPAIHLRQWQDGDLPRFGEMNAYPEVMRYFLKPLSPAESAAAMQRFREGIAQRGWGLWAVEVNGVFAGFTGLSEPPFESAFTACVEIGWRFRPEYWGRGIAYRAAREAEAYAFRELKLPELVSFTTESNLRSRRLMERLGFSRNPEEDFHHPLVPAGHPLIRHVLSRKSALHPSHP